MSTAQDGDTTTIVNSLYNLRHRLTSLRAAALASDPATGPSVSILRVLTNAETTLELWLNEQFGRGSHARRDNPLLSQGNISRIVRIRNEAIVLLQHCERTLRTSYPEAPATELPIDLYVADLSITMIVLSQC